MKTEFMIIALDGGAATGKSTTAHLLAKQAHLMHVDTGSHYRALTHLLLQADIPAEDSRIQATLNTITLDTVVDEYMATLEIDGATLDTSSLRSETVNRNVSDYASIPSLREKLKSYQRHQKDVAKAHDFAGLVMEGRDIGTVIFPDADLRVWLEADPSVRKARRASEGSVDTIEERDRLDSGRTHAPLRYSAGALRINTTENPPDTVVNTILKACENS